MKNEQQMTLYREHIEDFLSQWYTRFHDEPQKKLFEAMEYSLLAGGKRLRPVFAFEFCRLCGAPWQKATPFAAAVEMIHTYSLIHDDLPCMDNDDYRRGKLSNHKVYGETMATLAGDALLNRAFEVMLFQETVAPDKAVKAAAYISRCSGAYGMIGGQVQDLAMEGQKASDGQLREMVSLKTGALIRAACVGGVLLAGGNETCQKAAEQFADSIGLAFQIRDDMLDVIGTAEEMGKGVGTDAAKNTFVRLYGLEKCEELVQKYTDYAISALDAFDDTDYMKELALSLTARTV